MRPSTRIYFKNIEKFLFQKKNAFVKNNEITEFNKNGLVILKNIFDENLLKKITIHLSNENNILTPVYTNHKDFTLQKRDFVNGYIQIRLFKVKRYLSWLIMKIKYFEWNLKKI